MDGQGHQASCSQKKLKMEQGNQLKNIFFRYFSRLVFTFARKAEMGSYVEGKTQQQCRAGLAMHKAG